VIACLGLLFGLATSVSSAARPAALDHVYREMSASILRLTQRRELLEQAIEQRDPFAIADHDGSTASVYGLGIRDLRRQLGERGAEDVRERWLGILRQLIGAGELRPEERDRERGRRAANTDIAPVATLDLQGVDGIRPVVSSDRRYFVTHGMFKSRIDRINIGEVASGKIVRTIELLTPEFDRRIKGELWSVISPASDELYVMGPNLGVLHAYDLATGRHLRSTSYVLNNPRTGGQPHHPLEVSRDGARILMSHDFMPQLLDARTFRPIALPSRSEPRAKTFGFSDDSTQLAVMGSDCNLVLADARDGRFVRSFEAPMSATSLHFPGNGGQLVSYYDNDAADKSDPQAGHTYEWDLASGAGPEFHALHQRNLQMWRGGRYRISDFTSASFDVWDTERNQHRHVVANLGGKVARASVTADGRTLLVHGKSHVSPGGGRLAIYDVDQLFE
jgi:WD40 repeat protein